MLEEKLDILKDVWCSIENYEDKYVVSAEFPKGYSVFTDPLERIEVIDDRKESGRYWYVGEKANVNIEDIIDFIDETVKTNEEAIKKAKLYEEKVQELQRFFKNENMSYNELEKLSFSIKDELNTLPILQVATKPIPKKPFVSRNNKKPKDEATGKTATEGEKTGVEGNGEQTDKTPSEEPKTANFSDFQGENKENEAQERIIINNTDVTDIIGGQE